MSALAPLLEGFFSDRLMAQRRASSHTVAAYRDAWCLLLAYANERLATTPDKLTLEVLDADLIGAFLTHLEQDRANSARTRNARLAAIRSFFRYAALRVPEHANQIARVIAIPDKRSERALVNFLDEIEAEALVNAPDRTNALGRRDHTLLTLMLQTGLRVSELTGLRVKDVVVSTGPHVSCLGKGRKNRTTPLTRQTANVVGQWLLERAGSDDDPLFAGRRGQSLSTDAVSRLIDKQVSRAAIHCSSIGAKRVTPHVLRHTAAMRLLQAGIDTTVIALWLGHESVTSTQFYLHADLRLKERALERTAQPSTTPGRYQPTDTLMNFLTGL